MTKKVVIIGGGIIGLTSAYFLSRNGANVTLLEKDSFGEACSRGNQGWVCPALHAPMPEPGLVGSSMLGMMKKDDPLYLKPTAIPRLTPWLMQFIKHCNENDFQNAEAALHYLSRSTFQLYDFMKEDGVDFEMHNEGMLFAFFNEEVLNQKMKGFERKAEAYGHEAPVRLSGRELRDMEPNLSDKVFGGIWLKQQRHVNPQSLSKALIDKLAEMNVEMRPNEEVIGFDINDEKITAVQTSNELINADTILVTAGAWSSLLTKKLNYSLPMEAGKGYSITISNPNLSFTRPLYLGDSKAGITPFTGKVRIGGTMELSGINLKLDRGRIDSLRESILKYLKEPLTGDHEEEWTGMRPMTPDGLPVLGQIPDLENSYIATGHGMVGVAMAPATGKIISDIILSGEAKSKVGHFNPKRFVKKPSKSQTYKMFFT